MSDSRTTFLAAADMFVAQVAAIPLDLLDGPGLGDPARDGWDLRALVGHTSRSLVTVETYLDQPATEVAVPSAAAYYLAIVETLGADGPAVTERGRQAGAALGDDPAGYVAALAARVREKLHDYADGFVLTTIAGGMRLDEYLRTRTFELVVHGLDIDTATGASSTLGQEPLRDAVTLAAEVAVLSGRGADLVLALTGRRGLPDRFSIV